MSFGLFAQPGQGQNNSFEDWGVSEVYETLLDWQTNAGEGEGIISRDSSGSEGDFSVKLTTQDVNTVPTSGFLGYMTPDGYAIAYSSSVDSFYIDVQYDLVMGDTATIAVAQIVNGNPQPIFSLALLAGTQTTWATVAIPMVSPSQDSILIYAATENLVSGADPMVGSWLKVDNARFVHSTQTPAALNNFSFENWDVEEVIEPEFHSTSNALLQSNGFAPNVEEQTNGAFDGDSYARLATLDLIFFQIPGVLTNGSIDAQFNISQGVAYTAQPDSMVGHYKATIPVGDTAYISVQFFQAGQVLDEQTLVITQSASDWTPYTFNFNLPSDPDSMMFLAISGNSGGCELDLDQYTFYGGDLGIEKQEIAFGMYPNPTTDFLTVRSESRLDEVIIYSMTGAEVGRYATSHKVKVISVVDLPAGTYLVEARSGNMTSTQTLIKK